MSDEEMQGCFALVSILLVVGFWSTVAVVLLHFALKFW